MTLVRNIVSKHRTLAIILFASLYPILAVLLVNAMWRYVDPVWDPIRQFLGAKLDDALTGAVLFGPGLATFFFLPIRSKRLLYASATVLGLVYLVIMIPLAVLLRIYSYCFFNPSSIDCHYLL